MAKQKVNFEPIIHILAIVTVVLFIFNLFFISSLSSNLNQKILEAKELARPANLQLTIIPVACDKCFDINQVVSKIRSGNVNITKEEVLDANQAQALIQKYNIKKLPTVIVQGELNKTELNSSLEPVLDGLVFTALTPPYYDVTSQKLKGFVTATIINADSCTNCTNPTALINQLISSGVVIGQVNNLSESDGASLIVTYDIKTLPAVILSSDASEYKLIKDNWNAIGSVELDGNYVVRTMPPPFKNLTTNQIEGLVSLVYVTDSQCKDCYDVKTHKRIIQGYNLVILNETTVDVSTSDGLAYAKANNITLVPTIVISKESKAYASFYKVFKQVSQESSNGNLVFNALALMGKYKNLETGEVISPPTQQGQ